jgi:ubiquinone/menaquinone biosynthesis C-methylase UbiE
MADDLIAHYGDGSTEQSRLDRSPHGRLEFRRTQELLRRHLTRPGARILDVGGGTGVHAAWLAADGHEVHVLDVVPAHVVTADVGDARFLPAADGSVDAVLLFGPLYHLVSAVDRAAALAEAARVLRPGGQLFAAGISRYLSLMEKGANGSLTAGVEPVLRRALATGDHDERLSFVTAHFHTADELRAEVTAAGLGDIEVYGVEGPVWPALDQAGLGAFDDLVDAAVRCARLVETDPALVNASAHLLAVARLLTER